jgi:hypothetical protein
VRRAVVLLLLLGAGCVSHPVGPARTIAAYEGKARTTAESAISEVATARLVARAAADGRAFGPYTSQVLSAAEESLSGLDGTFGSVQPPGDDADQLRSRLSDVLAEAEDHVAALRIAARRGLLSDLGALAAPLDDDEATLEALVEELS